MIGYFKHRCSKERACYIPQDLMFEDTAKTRCETYRESTICTYDKKVSTVAASRLRLKIWLAFRTLDGMIHYVALHWYFGSFEGCDAAHRRLRAQTHPNDLCGLLAMGGLTSWTDPHRHCECQEADGRDWWLPHLWGFRSARTKWPPSPDKPDS